MSDILAGKEWCARIGKDLHGAEWFGAAGSGEPWQARSGMVWSCGSGIGGDRRGMNYYNHFVTR